MKPYHQKRHDMELGCSIDYQGVIQLKMSGNLSSDNEEDLNDWSESVKRAMRTAKKRDPNRVYCIIDMTGAQVDMDHKALIMLVKLMRHNKDYTTRTGVYGANVITKNIIDIGLKATRRNNMKVFFSREEAERWVFTGEMKKR